MAERKMVLPDVISTKLHPAVSVWAVATEKRLHPQAIMPQIITSTITADGYEHISQL